MDSVSSVLKTNVKYNRKESFTHFGSTYSSVKKDLCLIFCIFVMLMFQIKDILISDKDKSSKYKRQILNHDFFYQVWLISLNKSTHHLKTAFCIYSGQKGSKYFFTMLRIKLVLCKTILPNATTAIMKVVIFHSIFC